MTAHLVSVTQSGYELRCDRAGCKTVFSPETRREAKYQAATRGAARIAGWSTRPTTGRGARTAPDLCPACWVLS
jgi:hypothetical protein